MCTFSSFFIAHASPATVMTKYYTPQTKHKSHSEFHVFVNSCTLASNAGRHYVLWQM
jgi:hypothetical protein